MTDARQKQLIEEMISTMRKQQELIERQQEVNDGQQKQLEQMQAALWYFFMVGFYSGARWSV